MAQIAQFRALCNILKMGHCAPAVMRALQGFAGVEDRKILKLTSGMPGGIGWMGAECGCITSPIMALGIRYAEGFQRNEEEIPRALLIGRRYVERFRTLYGGVNCREIARLDFNDKKAVKDNLIRSYLPCFRAIYGAPGLLRDLSEEGVETAPAGRDRESIKAYGKVLESFRDIRFNSSHSVLGQLRDIIPVDDKILQASWGFLGGTLLLGMTCSALVGGILAVGLRFGEIEESFGRVLKGMIQLFRDGDIKREEANKFNRTINLAQELAIWFEKKFGYTKCYDLIKVDFKTSEGVDQYLSENKMNYCIKIAEKTAEKIREIIKKIPPKT